MPAPDIVKKLVDGFAGAGADAERTLLAREIKATDGQIDALVYELYGLTAAEIKIVESS